MFKRFNFTDRRQLTYKGNNPDLLIQLDLLENNLHQLKILFQLDRFIKSIPKYNVLVEPYIRNTSLEHNLGTVEEVNGKEFDIDYGALSPEDLKVRIKIVDEDLKVAALSDRIIPDTVEHDIKRQKESKSNSGSLFNFKNSSTIDTPFKIEIEQGRAPIVHCNSKIEFKSLLKNPAMECLFHQSILREILITYMLNDELQIGKDFNDVINFCYDLIGVHPPKADNDNYTRDEKMTDWINDVVDAFSRKKKFTEQFNRLRHRINV